LGFSKSLALNAQVNPNIEKCQLPGSGAKNLVGKIRVLKFITPSARFIVECSGYHSHGVGFQVPGLAEVFDLGQAKGREG